MANLIVEWHPERKERILLAAHYDTRPFPDRDPDNPRGVFVGANDGASGVAVLMELAHAMPELKGKLGVDFVLFDGEELVFQDEDPYFLGSDYFAQQYASHPPDYRYRWGVVLDMIGDANLQIYQDRFSAGWKDTKPLVTAIWDTAKRLGVREFIPTQVSGRGSRRSPGVAQHRQDSDLRHHRFRLSLLAHARRHGRQMLGVVAGQGRLGDASLAGRRGTVGCLGTHAEWAWLKGRLISTAGAACVAASSCTPAKPHGVSSFAVRDGQGGCRT